MNEPTLTLTWMEVSALVGILADYAAVRDGRSGGDLTEPDGGADDEEILALATILHADEEGTRKLLRKLLDFQDDGANAMELRGLEPRAS